MWLRIHTVCLPVKWTSLPIVDRSDTPVYTPVLVPLHDTTLVVGYARVDAAVHVVSASSGDVLIARKDLGQEKTILRVAVDFRLVPSPCGRIMLAMFKLIRLGDPRRRGIDTADLQEAKGLLEN
jgi:hypothetical protein